MIGPTLDGATFRGMGLINWYQILKDIWLIDSCRSIKSTIHVYNSWFLHIIRHCLSNNMPQAMISDAPDRPANSHMTVACRETLVWMRAHFRVVCEFSDSVIKYKPHRMLHGQHLKSRHGWVITII